MTSKEKAIEAVNALFADQALGLSDAIEALEEVADMCQTSIDCLNEDLLADED